MSINEILKNSKSRNINSILNDQNHRRDRKERENPWFASLAGRVSGSIKGARRWGAEISGAAASSSSGRALRWAAGTVKKSRTLFIVARNYD